MKSTETIFAELGRAGFFEVPVLAQPQRSAA
jgi:hypothetical protein